MRFSKLLDEIRRVGDVLLHNNCPTIAGVHHLQIFQMAFPELIHIREFGEEEVKSRMERALLGEGLKNLDALALNRR